MKKQSKLLKVLSIILIVIGALSLLSSIASIAMKGIIEQSYAALGMAAPTTVTYIIMFVGSVIVLVAGIIGVAYKSRQAVLVMGILLAAYYIIDIIFSTVTMGFSALSLISLIWPILYLWGWYQSN